MKAALRSIAAATLLCAPLPASAIDVSPEVQKVQDCVSANLPKLQSVQTVQLVARGRQDSVNEMRATFWWRRFPNGLSKLRILVDQPEDMRGSGVLLVEREDGTDTFLYLPEVKRVRRITGRHMSGALFGTDLTYEHLERLEGLSADTKISRKPDAMLDGRAVYVLESIPAPRTAAAPDAGSSEAQRGSAPVDPVVSELSGIERVVTVVDQSTCVPLRTEMYGRGGALRWLMTTDASKITQEGSGHVPGQVKLEDLKRGSSTELVIERIDTGKELPERYFSEAALAQGAD